MSKVSRKTCFSIMPINKGFDGISQAIKEAATKCGMTYVRGDDWNKPGNIMAQIREGIKEATVIVADVSGNNPNVFYELGVAHELKGPEQVVIITHSSPPFPFDVSAFRHRCYVHSPAGLAELRTNLVHCIREAAKSTVEEGWKVIRGPLERTRMIVRDLKRLVDNAQGKEIRMVSGLGSLAISHLEETDKELGQAYNDGLIEERNALRKVLVKGATLKSLIHPPRMFTPRNWKERLSARYLRLIGLLEGKSDIPPGDGQAEEDLVAIARSTIRLTPVPMPHLFIIGDEVAYEGMKRGGSRGYAMTHCETNRQAVRDLITEFDYHFGECGQGSPCSHAEIAAQLKRFLDEATQTE